MKLVFFYLSIFSLLAKADGILNNSCFHINKDGTIKRLESIVGCNIEITSSSPTSVQGRFYDKYESFAIQVNKKAENSYSVLESHNSTHFEDIVADFPTLNQTQIVNSKVTDQTSCSRYLSKVMPVVKNDSLTCITIDEEFCSRFYQNIKALGFKRGRKSTTEDIKKCEPIISKTFEAVEMALGGRWADKNYSNLAKSRMNEIKGFSDKQLTKKMAAKVSLNYNLYDTDPKSGFVKISSIREGYSLMNEMFKKCETFFLDREISPKGGTSKEELQTR